MKLALDEMHSPVVATVLAAEGVDIVSVAAATTLRGSTDETLLEWSTMQKRVLVTENIVDFQVIATSWAVSGKSHSGLLFTHPRRFARASRAYPGNVIEALRWWRQQSDVTLVSDDSSPVWWL